MPNHPTQEATRRILESSGTLIKNDHFVYASGDHGSGWIAKDLINLNPELAYELGQLLGQEIRRHGLKPDVVCGPAIGGVICAQYTALALGSRCIFSERVLNEEGKTINFDIKRGYAEVIRNQSVLIVDDIINTGFSVLLTYQAVVQAGGKPLGIAAYVNRGNVGAKELGVKILFISMKSVFQPGLQKPAHFAKAPGRSMFSTPMEQNLVSDEKPLSFHKA